MTRRAGTPRPLAGAFALVAVTLGWITVPAAPQVASTASITGIVIDGGSLKPVGNSALQLLASSAYSPLRLVGRADGTFEASGLRPGRYVVRVFAKGYLDGAYGRIAPDAPEGSVVVREGERVSGISIRVWREASISGRVTDETGEVLPGVQVIAHRRSVRPGGALLERTAVVLTDDMGRYRIGALTPATYFVSVPSSRTTVPPDLAEGYRHGYRVGDIAIGQSNNLPFLASARVASETYPTTYYGHSATLRSATPVVVSSGEERLAVDIALRPTRAVNVRGRVQMAGGLSLMVPLRLIPLVEGDDAADYENHSAFTIPGADGRFQFSGVTPGRYILRSMVSFPASQNELLIRDWRLSMLAAADREPPALRLRPPPPRREWWAKQVISVADDLNDVVVDLLTAPRVGGRVEFQGAEPGAAVTKLYVSLEPADGRVTDYLGSGWVQEKSREFTTYGAPAGRYLVRVHGELPGWQVRSAMQAGLDRLDTPLGLSDRDVTDVVVTMTRERPEITGTVRTSQNAPDPEASVLIFPVDRASWKDFGVTSRRFVAVRVSNDGTYTLAAPPPGDYLMVALPAAQAIEWQDPAVLGRLSSVASPIRIDRAAVFSQDLRTTAGR